MAMQGPFDWQGRLESEGQVVFGNRWLGVVTGSGPLTVARDGLRMGRRPVVTLDRVTAVGAAPRRLTVFYRPLTGERMNLFERRAGQKRMVLALSRWGPVRADDLAVWLLKLKGGPTAEVDSKLGGAGYARVYQLRD
jgi:hypothetical protein